MANESRGGVRPLIRQMLKGARGVRGTFQRTFYRGRYTIRDRYLKNPASHQQFTRHTPALSVEQRRVADDLRRTGLASADVEALCGRTEAWPRLQQIADDFKNSDRVRSAANKLSQSFGKQKLRNDAYLVKLNPDGPTLLPDDQLLMIGLSAPVLDVVNWYFGMWSKLIYTDMWHSIQIDLGTRIGSQRWHRDPEDQSIVKLYLYFAPTDAGTGPMQYVVGSAKATGGRYSPLWPWQPFGDRYPADGELEKVVPEGDWQLMTGNVGTFYFCDTDGLHRGGIARTGSRLLATWTFVTPAALGFTAQRRFTLADPIARVDREAAAFALT